ncbi:hypothetical protein ZWY2020_024505 [Hordeum vulgare]|nr:hypothetical protein ZWY2020_024505 [Hordeum vulgare]
MRTLPFSPPPLPLCFLGVVWGLLQFLVSYKITTGAYPGHRHGKTTSDHARGAREAGRWDLVAARAVKEAARWDLAAVRAVRDTLLLADMLYSGNKRSMCAQSKFLPTLPCATEPHAFVVGRRGLLGEAKAKSDKNREKLRFALVPNLVASLTTLDQAKRKTAYRRPHISHAACRAAPPFADGLLPHAHRGDNAAPPPKLPRRL